MYSLNLQSSSGEVEIFEQHKEACDFAKANIGFVVVANVQKWFAGERNAIMAIKKQEMTLVKRNHENQIESQNSDNFLEIHDAYEVEFDDPQSIENVEGRLFWDEIYESSDPDDWNRSNEEGWYYDD